MSQTFTALVQPDPPNYNVYYSWETKTGRRSATCSYNTYVRTLRAQPQFGDLIDVDGDGNILGLHPEYTDGN